MGAHELAEDQLELTRRQIAAGVLPESDVIWRGGDAGPAPGGGGAGRGPDRARRRPAARAAEPAGRRVGAAHLSRWTPPASCTWRCRSPRPSPAPRASAPSWAACASTCAGSPWTWTWPATAACPGWTCAAGSARWARTSATAGPWISAVDGNGRQWSVGLRFGWAPLGVAARAEMPPAGVGPAPERARPRADPGGHARPDPGGAAGHRHRRARSCSPRPSSAIWPSAAWTSSSAASSTACRSNFLVAQRQAELAQARLAELEALIQHEKASSDLQLATGELLEARQLRFDVNGG